MERTALKQAMETKGYDPKQLAQEVGVSERYIYYILQGVRNPSLKITKSIVETLDINITVM